MRDLSPSPQHYLFKLPLSKVIGRLLNKILQLKTVRGRQSVRERGQKSQNLEKRAPLLQKRRRHDRFAKTG
jgi:hypothetical protein